MLNTNLPMIFKSYVPYPRSTSQFNYVCKKMFFIAVAEEIEHEFFPNEEGGEKSALIRMGSTRKRTFSDASPKKHKLQTEASVVSKDTEEEDEDDEEKVTIVRPSKKILVFPLTCSKTLGLVCRQNFFYYFKSL